MGSLGLGIKMQIGRLLQSEQNLKRIEHKEKAALSKASPDRGHRQKTDTDHRARITLPGAVASHY